MVVAALKISILIPVPIPSLFLSCRICSTPKSRLAHVFSDSVSISVGGERRAGNETEVGIGVDAPEVESLTLPCLCRVQPPCCESESVGDEARRKLSLPYAHKTGTTQGDSFLTGPRRSETAVHSEQRFPFFFNHRSILARPPETEHS